MDLSKLAFVDVETTGSSFGMDRIIEIGVIRVEENQIVKKINTLVNPETYVSPYIEYMTGISSSELIGAPKFEDIKEEVFETLQDCIFVAHNVRFDYGFIREEFKRYNKSFNSQCLCTVKLSRNLYPTYTHHSLDSLINRFNFNCTHRHRAFDDAHVLWQFFQHIAKEFQEDVLLSTCKLICRKPSLPPHLSKDAIDSLPESPGIYIFYDQNNIPLYVGKSKNIKDRVSGHFLQVYDSEKEMEMCQQVHRIDFKITVGELGALLMESELVKTLQPYYNKSLKKKEEIVVLMYEETEDYITPKIKILSGVLTEQLTKVLGIFKSKKQAKEYLQFIVSEHNLCAKLLNLEKTKNSCFAHKIGVCKGACIGKESKEDYNRRLIEAFDKKRIEKWTYDGPILIEEKNYKEGVSEGYIFDNWRHVATIYSNNLSTTINRNNYLYFDLDIYHILRGFFRKNVKIKKLTYPKMEELLQSYV